MATRILVTGGSGFIGSNYLHHALHRRGLLPDDVLPGLERYPADRDDEVQILNLDALTYAARPENTRALEGHDAYAFRQVDICDGEAVGQAFQDFEPDAVVHFAAESHVDRSIEAGDVFVRTNVQGTQVLLDAARRHDVDAFLHVSTDEVYGSIDHGSFREADPYNPSSPYSASKAGSDLLVLAHHHTYGVPACITRCTNNFGPNQHPEKLLPKVISLASRDEPLPIYGDGKNVRDWLYVLDHCAALDTVLEARDWGSVTNVAAQDERTNLEVVHAVLEALGKPRSLIRFVPDRPGHDRRYSLDDARLRAMGWTPRTSFADGLRDTIASLEVPA